MTVFCEGAAAAIIIFSLTGGREGKITSYNPPVEIITHPGVLVNIYENLFNDGTNLSHSDRTLLFAKSPRATQAFTPRILDGTGYTNIPEYDFSNAFESEISLGDDFYYVSIVRNNGSYIYEVDVKNREIKVVYNKPYSDRTNKNFGQVAKALNNPFVIKDETGVLYAFNYDPSPTYNVQCISCPPGLCAIRGANNEIVCFDCKKVKSSLNQINNNLGNIL